jgi:hypothetical protein
MKSTAKLKKLNKKIFNRSFFGKSLKKKVLNLITKNLYTNKLVYQIIKKPLKKSKSLLKRFHIKSFSNKKSQKALTFTEIEIIEFT